MPLAPQTFVRRHRRAALHSSREGEHRRESGDQGWGIPSVRRPSSTSAVTTDTIPSDSRVESLRATYNRHVVSEIQQVYESRHCPSDPDTWTVLWMVTVYGVQEGMRIVRRQQLPDRISLEQTEAPERNLLNLPDINEF